MVERVGGTSGIVTVSVMTTDGTATADVDYTALTPRRITFADGDAGPKPVGIPIINDTLAEPDETFVVTLSDPQGGATLESPARSTATVTIHDNDGPGAADLVTSVAPKRLTFRWLAAPNVASYKLMRRASANADFVQVGADLASDVTATKIDIPVHLYPWAGPAPDYRLDSCNPAGCAPSNIVTHDRVLSALATSYIKASDTGMGAQFGSAVAVSADAKTVAIGAPFANGEAGSVYVYLAPVTGPPLAPNPLKIAAPSAQAMHFGASVALSEDGNTLVVGAPFDSNSQKGVGTYPAAPNVDAPHSGGVFVYTRNPGVPLSFSAPVYIKAPDADAGDEFGTAVALKDTVLVIGAPRQDSPSIATADDTNAAVDSGAAYAFYANAGTWTEASHIFKAIDVANGDLFGSSVAVSRGGAIIIVGAPNTDAAAADSGAAYRFKRNDGGAAVPAWDLGFLIPTNGRAGDLYGTAVAASADGTVFAVGAPQEDDPNTTTTDAGAVYLYTSFAPPAINLQRVTATHPHNGAGFGSSLALNGDGTIVAAGSPDESADEMGVDGRADAPLVKARAGAVDVLARQPGAEWSTAVAHYVKAMLADAADRFGTAVGLSNDGTTLVVGAIGEDGNGTNINSDNNLGDNSVADSGAAYLF